MELDSNNNITGIRCCLINYNFDKIVFIKDFKIDDKMTIDNVEFEIITYINIDVALMDGIYLICDLKTSTHDVLTRKMPRLEKYIKQVIDLSSLWLILDMYNLYDKYVDNIEYYLDKFYF